MGKRQITTRMVELIMERTEIVIGKMRIDVVHKEALYINLNGYTYYIDDSTGEQIFKKYNDSYREDGEKGPFDV